MIERLNHHHHHYHIYMCVCIHIMLFIHMHILLLYIFNTHTVLAFLSIFMSVQFNSVQSLSHVRLFETP